jgi:hypothetical protein
MLFPRFAQKVGVEGGIARSKEVRRVPAHFAGRSSRIDPIVRLTPYEIGPVPADEQNSYKPL